MIYFVHDQLHVVCTNRSKSSYLILILCHSAFFDERLGILLHNWSMFLDRLVHHWLREETEVCTV